MDTKIEIVNENSMRLEIEFSDGTRPIYRTFYLYKDDNHIELSRYELDELQRMIKAMLEYV